MEIKVLIENSQRNENFISAHGLSVLVEVFGKNILLDTGPDESFIQNAKVMGVDIAAVDFVVISHFHSDHIGGLKGFLSANNKAKVYISKFAFDDFYSLIQEEMKYFGLDKNEYDIGRFIFVDNAIKVCEGVKIISNLNYSFDNPLNDKYFKKIGDSFIKDDFSHEIAIIINEGKNNVLLSGCFHSGVYNTVNTANLLNGEITHVLGGFHLENKNRVPLKYFDELTQLLIEKKIISYTGHCTGKHYFQELQTTLGSAVIPIFSGAKYTI